MKKPDQGGKIDLTGFRKIDKDRYTDSQPQS